MSILTRFIILLSALTWSAAAVAAQPGTPAAAQSATRAAHAGGSVAGRVTLEGKAAPGLQVVLLLNGRTPAATATTDAEGRYRVQDVPPARYEVTPAAPAYVAEVRAGQKTAGLSVNVVAGEAVEGVDFTLKKGGVITGQVTDAEGQPVIGERVSLYALDAEGRSSAPTVWNPSMLETDDRGVYRLYGLPAGRYKVSVGSVGGVIRAGGRRAVYARTFHPAESDEERAGVVEVTAGAEARGVDVRLGPAAQTYTASGRVVDAQTGAPLPGASFSYAPLGAVGGRQTPIGRGQRSGTGGEFRLEGLLPGRYALFSSSEGLGDFYADPVAFEVSGADVEGLEVRLRRGVSVSGAFVVEGASAPGILSRLAGVSLGAFLFQSELNSPGLLASRISPDGTFRASGLRPGKLGIAPNSARVPQGFVILRVEREGVEQRGFVDLQPGQDVTGLRIVLGYGTGSIRGRVNVTGGALPGGTRLTAILRRAGSYASTSSFTAQVDARGEFVFGGLAAGSYELILGGAPVATPQGLKPSTVPVVRRAVTVTDGAASEVAITLDLAAGRTGNAQ